MVKFDLIFKNYKKLLLTAGVSGAIGLAGLYASYQKLSADTSCFRRHYPPSANYPDLKEHYNCMARQMTPKIYYKLSERRTANGVTLDQCIQPGVDIPGDPDTAHKVVGIVAGDEESYKLFEKLFDKVIDMRHGGYDKHRRHNTDMDFSQIKGAELDPKYVKSCRVRGVRSVRGFPLSPASTRAERRHLERIVTNALTGLKYEFRGEYHSMLELRKQKRLNEEITFVMQDHARDYLRSTGLMRDWPDARGVYINEEKNFLVIVNEEDHIRIISIEKGGSMKSVLQQFSKAVKEVEHLVEKEGYEFMWNPHLGYIATCPCNLGTGMRCGVYISLPRLSRDPRFDFIIRSLMLEKRPVDETNPHTVYNISNLYRLGRTEAQIAQTVIDGVRKLISMERLLEHGKQIDHLIPMRIHPLLLQSALNY